MKPRSSQDLETGEISATHVLAIAPVETPLLDGAPFLAPAGNDM
jgi:hypothetical protein